MAIQVEEVSKRFGVQGVLDRVSLHVAPGEMFVLLGPSGSGKSTLLRLMAGLSTPDRGRILFMGRDVTALPPQKRDTGFVFQNYSVFRHMTVAQNIEFGLRLRHVPRAERARRGDALLELVGLPGFGRREAAELSGGQQQRVAIARALAYEPKVLLLDEPFGALDVKIRTQLRRSLREIHDRLRITTVLVTHDQEEAFQLGDRIGLMDRGRLVEIGRPEDLYARPRTLFAATFLGSGAVLVGRMESGRAHFEGFDFSVAPLLLYEEGASTHLLLRPEDLRVSATAPPPDRMTLGSGQVIEQTFAGAQRRVRVRLPRHADVHPASTPGPSPDAVMVDALVPAHETLPEGDVWVTVERWHFLDPPPSSLLVADDGSGPPRALELARDLARALEARVTVVVVARDASLVEPLGWRIQRRLRAVGLDDAELRLRFGEPAEQILQEQTDLLSQMIVFAPRASRESWLEKMRLVPRSRERIGRTIAAVLENARVPLLLAADRPASLRKATVVSLGGTDGGHLLRTAVKIARPLGMSLDVLEVDSETEVRGDRAIEGVGVSAPRRIESRAPAEIRRQVLAENSDWIVVPVLRRGLRQVNEIPAAVQSILGAADRPVLVVPVIRGEVAEAERVAARS
jgi:sulfate transport system ATP-binding protein